MACDAIGVWPANYTTSRAVFPLSRFGLDAPKAAIWVESLPLGVDIGGGGDILSIVNNVCS